jgi:hypothetical protein
MARKTASYKKIRAPKVTIGRNTDAGFAIAVDVTDLRAPAFQSYTHPKRNQKIAVQFADHEEVVSRGIWQQFIEQNAMRVTEPDVDVVSVQQARRSEAVYVSFVGHNQPLYQVLRVAASLGQRWQKMPVLQTRYLLTAPDLGEWVRKVVAGQPMRAFTFPMYIMLRWFSVAHSPYQLERHGKHWLVQQGDKSLALSVEQETVANDLLANGLFALRDNAVFASDTGIALMNFFARFYEEQFLQEYGKAASWQADEPLVMASVDTLALFNKPSKRARKPLKFPSKPMKQGGDRWHVKR